MKNENLNINSVKSSEAAQVSLVDEVSNESPNIDVAIWGKALLSATDVALRLYSGLSVSSLSLEPSDPVSTIHYRPDWLLHEDIRKHFPAIQRLTEEVIERAIEKVAEGRHPAIEITSPRDDSDEQYWPIANVTEAVDRIGVFAKPDYVDVAADVALIANWSSIIKLCVEVAIDTRLSISEVWDILLPDTTRWLAADAYHLAAMTVAMFDFGAAPTYLSIFNLRGRGIEYRVPAAQVDDLSFEQMAILASVGAVASTIATGKVAYDTHDPFYNATVGHIRRESFNVEKRLKAFSRQYGPAAEELVKSRWHTIEKLAKMLLRVYCLLGDEITDITHGGDFDVWLPRY